MNFKEYINELSFMSALNESQLTLQDLVDNFRKVFPYSDKEAKVIHYKTIGEDTNDMKCIGQVASEENPGKHYEVTALFHRDNIELPFSIKNLGKVNCTCNAYRYNISHPNKNTQNQSEPIPPYSSIPNKERNPHKESSVCKHLYSFLIFLYNKHIIRNN